MSAEGTQLIEGALAALEAGRAAEARESAEQAVRRAVTLGDAALERRAQGVLGRALIACGAAPHAVARALARSIALARSEHESLAAPRRKALLADPEVRAVEAAARALLAHDDAPSPASPPPERKTGARPEVPIPPPRPATRFPYERLIGSSPAMQKVFQVLDKVVPTLHPVVVQGESGTGKELVARAIHQYGPRRGRPFVAENCAALSETLLEAELFGHVKGAFTGADRDNKGLFELASGGTLFLDEVGDMSERMQKKLLRVLQEGELRPVGGRRTIAIDVRIISASNKDLRRLVEAGLFREDLFYRLNVIAVTLPPLRERKEDIPLLVEWILEKAARSVAGGHPHRDAPYHGGHPRHTPGPDGAPRPVRRVDPEVLRLLAAYDWPGNVRELENEVLRMVALSDDRIEAAVVSPRVREGRMAGQLSADGLLERLAGRPLPEIEAAVAREVISRALGETGWHRTQAARKLGIPTSTLFNKMRRLGLE